MSKFEFLFAYVCFDKMYVTFYLRPMQLLNIRRHCGQINEVMKLPFFLNLDNYVIYTLIYAFTSVVMLFAATPH